MRTLYCLVSITTNCVSQIFAASLRLEIIHVHEAISFYFRPLMLYMAVYNLELLGVKMHIVVDAINRKKK